MPSDPRVHRVATLVAWMQFNRYPRLRALLQKVLEAYVDDHSSFDVTMGDCYAFARYIEVMVERRGFTDPSSESILAWFARAKTEESWNAAIAKDESGAVEHWVGELRLLNYAVWVSRRMPANTPRARDLERLFRLMWHILADNGRLRRWQAEGSRTG